MHCNDREILKRGQEWIELLLKGEPQNAAWIDTYANLLYKQGRTNEALIEESKAARLSPEQEDIKGNYAKMILGLPTWDSRGYN